jgi:hypothetical protein
MRGDEGVHEGLEVRPPPLRKCVANLPFVGDALASELRADGCKALVQPILEALNLVVLGAEVVARPSHVSIHLRCSFGNVQLEERISNLQHEDMRMVMLVADQDSLARTAHSMLLVVFFQPLQTRKY